jgi:hypothetical protein
MITGGFGLVIVFIDHLQNVATNTCDTTTELTTPKISNYGTHTFFSVFTSRCLVAAPTADVPPPLGSRTVPGLSDQRLTSHNCNSQLTQSRQGQSQGYLRPACLGVQHPSVTQDQIFITVRQL